MTSNPPLRTLAIAAVVCLLAAGVAATAAVPSRVNGETTFGPTGVNVPDAEFDYLRAGRSWTPQLYVNASLDVRGAFNLTNFTGATHTHHNTTTGGRLPQADRYVRLTGTAQSSALTANSTMSFQRLNTSISLLSSDPPVNQGWQAALPAPYVDLRLPYGVVIGDSIAEGATGSSGQYGRLNDNGAGTYDANEPNKPGQLSYELGNMTGLYWYNHGIYGQNSTQVWARWSRDVLAQVYNPGDGRGSQTLPSASKPTFVLVVIGTNDISNGVPAQVTRDRLRDMADSARENNITAIFLTVGARNPNTDATARREMAAWMTQELPPRGALVVDWYWWGENPDGSGSVNRFLIEDTVHPSLGGYKALARHILRQLEGVAIYSDGFLIETPIDIEFPPVDYARPASITVTVGAETYVLTVPNEEHVFVPVHMKPQSVTSRWTISSATTITGTGANTGLAKVYAHLSATPRT